MSVPCALLRYIMTLEKIVDVSLEQTKKHNFEFKTKLQGRHNGCEGKMKRFFSWDSFLQLEKKLLS